MDRRPLGDAIVAIRKITLREFNHLSSSGSGLVSFIGEEFEWFANDAASVIGAIALGRRGRGCNYCILARDEMGVFHAVGARENLDNLRAARNELARAMAAVEMREEETSGTRVSGLACCPTEEPG